MRFRIPTSRIDAAAIITATTVASLGAAGVKIESLPVERIGESADLLAAACALYHWRHGHQHAARQTGDQP